MRLVIGRPVNSCWPDEISHFSRRGFTLLEICFSLCILAVILGAVLPNIFGWIKEQRLRAPANQLALLARTARLEAIEHQQPYQIMVSGNQLWLSPVAPPHSANPQTFANRGTDQTDQDANLEVMPEPYLIPESTTVLLQRWNESKPHPEKEWHWTFQPSGLCEPITVKFLQDSAQLQIQFDPLTATIAKEEYEIP